MTATIRRFTEVTLNDVFQSNFNPKTRLCCHLLHFKKPGKEKDVVRIRKKDDNTMSSKRYFRLIYLESHGVLMALFILKNEIANILKNIDELNIGRPFWILGPRSTSMWNDTPVVTTTNPLWGDFCKSVISTKSFNMGPTTEFIMNSFCIDVKELMNVEAVFDSCCGCELNDGRYGNTCSCIDHRTRLLNVPRITFEIPNVGVPKTWMPYQSTQMARLILEPTTIAHPPDNTFSYYQLGERVGEVLQNHKGGFRIIGWFKATPVEGDEVASGITLHASQIIPLKEALPKVTLDDTCYRNRPAARDQDDQRQAAQQPPRSLLRGNAFSVPSSTIPPPTNQIAPQAGRRNTRQQ